MQFRFSKPLTPYSLPLIPSRGSSLLDVIFGTALFLIVFLGIFGALRLSFALVESAKLKTGGLALASERVEYLRSLNYDEVGTVGGIPSGTLEQEETVSLNDVSYTRRTFIQYVDDAEDGSGGSDENGVSTDYKVAKVTVSWPFRESTRSLSLITNIIPTGIESIVGGGTLRVTVQNAQGVAVPSAQVSVVNNATTPAISLSTFTNTAGEVTFSGAPAASGYQITVSKTGYSSAQTYSVGGGNPNPSPGHLTVGEGQTTSSSLSIDVLGSIAITTHEVGTTTPIGNVAFSIRGDKTIGTDAEEDPVYKYTENSTTGASGERTLSSLEWDNYTITIDDTATGYDIAGICVPQPLSLLAGETETVDISLTENVAHSLLVDVKNTAGDVLSGASVRLYRGAYDTSSTSSSCGQSFFGDGLSQGTVAIGNPYSADVSLSGYQIQTLSNVEVDGVSRLSVVLGSL